MQCSWLNFIYERSISFHRSSEPTYKIDVTFAKSIEAMHALFAFPGTVAVVNVVHFTLVLQGGGIV